MFDELMPAQANQSHFFIDITGIPDGLVMVTDFKSNADQLSDEYEFIINIVSMQHFNEQDVLDKNVTLIMKWAQGDRYISGYLSELAYLGKNKDGEHYQLTLTSKLKRLTLTRANRVFTQVSVGEIIKQVLTKNAYPQAEVSIEAQGPTLDMCVQYDETDYDFVTRLMRKYGLVSGYIQSAKQAVLYVCEDSAKLAQKSESIDLGYVGPSSQVRLSETIFAVSRKRQLLAQEVVLDDYNDEQPQNLTVSSQNRHQVQGIGQVQHYGENYKSTADGQLLANVRQQSLDCMRDIIVVDTDCRALRPGCLLTIYDHPDYNGRYLVMSVKHFANQKSALNYGDHISGLTYKNQACIIPYDVPFKAEIPASRRVFTTFTATIEQEIDDDGRYRIKLPFETQDMSNPSKPSRLVQPYGGSGHGMHFPLSKGTEVIIAGENGDLDRPIILGAIYNQNSPSPVNSQNPTENKLVTKAGHTLVMDDKSAEEKIKLATKSSENALLLDATNDNHQASLISQKGDIHIQAKGSLNFGAEGDHNVTTGANLTIAAQDNFQLQTRQGDVELQSAAAIKLAAEQAIAIETSTDAISLKSESELNLQAGQDTSLYSENGNIEVQAPQGDIVINSGGNISLFGSGNGSIQLKQAGASIELDSAGNLTIDANNITLSAANIAIKGNAVSNN
ncbi:type VI secretion system Vgr family protein [Marinifaba aquimaris]|uniref:type VI secretion system Vgr family protein n=1 Tax=Marinifaba aquimaris TaxID=2741323 RepID=UPI001FE73D96|nr:type VI secretion system tip protein TssI/VgrG [Marinifaba aquimaris]